MARLGRAQPFRPLVQQRNLALLVKSIALTETITGTEVLNRAIARALVETITGTEAISTNKVTVLSLSESIPSVETIDFAASTYIRSLVEVITGVEIIDIHGVWTLENLQTSAYSDEALSTSLWDGASEQTSNWTEEIL